MHDEMENNAQKQRVPYNPLEDCTWPDAAPDPSCSSDAHELLLNDVSGMSETKVKRIRFPRNETDVLRIVDRAVDCGERVCVRGTKHSMGGQSLLADGTCIDTEFLNHISYDPAEESVTCGVGCTWADVIRCLNFHQKSPVTLQSYCNFSVGGTLAVNAHGITSDSCLADSVRRFRLVRYNAERDSSEVIVCNLGDNLFRLALGGYGLFGIIVEVTLDVADNSILFLDSFTNLSVSGDDCKFLRVWDQCKDDPTVDIKLARLNILTLDTASLYVFHKNTNAPKGTFSQLPLKPRGLSSSGRLLYKWALPLLKDLRQYAEETTGKAFDMPEHGCETSRNSVLWESALPLSKLYEPLVVMESSFCLQEFFVPRDRFSDFIREVRPIYKEIDEYQRQGFPDRGVAPQSLVLLNTTIRFVEQDTNTTLAYSRHPTGSFAFVLYYRIKKIKAIEEDLGVFHNRLGELAIELGGTFYLPYRRCYDQNLLCRAYPAVKEFAQKKEQLDPLGVFSNEWFDKYGASFCSKDFLNRKNKIERGVKNQSICAIPKEKPRQPISKKAFMEWLPRSEDPNLQQRFDSYRTLLRSATLRKRFSDEFLVSVFNIKDPQHVMRVMVRAAADPKNQNDVEIFRSIRNHFHQNVSGTLPALNEAWRAVRQLGRQKKELTRQTATILHRLGWFGCVDSFLSIGDHGKTVRSFQEVGALGRNSESKVYIAHSFSPEADDLSLAAVLERGSLDAVGDVRIQYDYVTDDVSAFDVIPSNSVRLVTLFQGLHHFPPARLYEFLTEVWRVLQFGGMFLFREHDMKLDDKASASVTSSPVAMLDLAHSVFNAVTGVSVEDEQKEIRAFRPVEEWRELMTKIGFLDTMNYGLESEDCTFDFMLCFSKGPVQPPPPKKVPVPSALEGPSPPPMIRVLLDQLPSSIVGAGTKVVTILLQKLPSLKQNIHEFLQNVLHAALTSEEKSNQANSSQLHTDLVIPLVKQLADFVDRNIEKLLSVTSGAQALLADMRMRENADLIGLLSTPEFALVLPFLQRKADRSPESLSTMEKATIGFFESNFPTLLQLGNTTLERENADKEASSRSDTGILPNLVSKAEVLDVIEQLSNAMPGLLDPSISLKNSGLTLSQQSTLVAGLDSPDLGAFAEKVTQNFDVASWRELRWWLMDSADSVASRGDLPTKEMLLSRKLNHPWHHSMRAFLRRPHIQLKSQTLFALRLLDLQDFVELYKEAKREAAEILMAQNATDPPPHLTFGETKIIADQTRSIARSTRTKNIRIDFANSKYHDLFDVAEVINARFGYTSITSSLTDVTDEVRSFHADVQHRISEQRKQTGNQKNLDVAKKNRQTVPVGWLPIHEDNLVSFRNKSTASKLGDSMRRAVVSTSTLGLKGSNVLKLEYVPIRSPVDPKAVEFICDTAREKGLIDGDLHLNDGHYTWFKLSEWMQVEIMDIFTKSMDHSPWYHFPFFEYLFLYFQVLSQECGIVAKENGLARAYGSMAFAVDLVPGIVMSFLFAQLQLLAMPLRQCLGSSYEDTENMVEEILLLAPIPNDAEPLTFMRRNIDERIRRVALLSQPAGGVSSLYSVSLPTFKAMGEILVLLGQKMPSARVLQISNQCVVQTLLVITFDEPSNAPTSHSFLRQLKSDIESLQGTRIVLKYAFPNSDASLRDAGEKDSRNVHLAVKVYVPSLLSLVHLVSQYDQVKVKQIYDFWC